MKNFVYSIPTKVYFGKGQLDNLGAELSSYGKNVLLTYGGGSIKKNGVYDKIMEQIRKYDLNVFELSGIDPNPRITSVKEGARICKENNVDVVLAAGGGSTIDCSKFICANAADDVEDPWDYFIGKAKVTKALPLVSILTLSATGSEMDCGGVLTNIETREKLGSGNPILRPKASFLDPTITYSVSKYQTACGTADIFSHICEVYFNLGSDFYMLRRFMEGMFKTLVKYGPIAVEEPENYEARANLMWTSSWAINDFIKCGDGIPWSCHPIEHELSAFYDITHGLGLAILTPRWMEYCLNEKTVDTYVEFGTNVFDIDPYLDKFEIAKKAIARTYDFLFNQLKLTDTLTKVGIKEEDFEKMAENACRNGGAIDGFVRLEKDDVVNILKMCK
ncbi:MAG: iron-containing alcohol dehydrogenase [Erysipelotrichaceae bacterium]|nr:iron-containing alcohol dehydrogenase [Erysipelotrichaceae bacterium]